MRTARATAAPLTILTLTLALAAPGALAEHEGTTLFEREWAYLGALDDLAWFEVPDPTGPRSGVCYERHYDTQTTGAWSAVVRDHDGDPVIVDGNAGGPYVHADVPLATMPPNVGVWSIEVHAAGASPYVHVELTFVDDVSEGCSFHH